MQKTRLGRTEIFISRIGLGCVTFGREIGESDSQSILDHALAAGINFFDTAEAYGGGQSREARFHRYGVSDAREVSSEMSSSERILGDWVRSRQCRDQVVICTKVSTGASKANIDRALGESLQRLRTDYVDIYKIHSPDANVDIGETLDALAEHVASGTVRAIGCSNFTAQQLREALDYSKSAGQPRFEITQPPYSLVARDAEPTLFTLCQSHEIAVTPYSPLGAGFLTGKYREGVKNLPQGTRFDIAPGHQDQYFSKPAFRVVDLLAGLAETTGVPMVKLAMSWVMTHPAVTATLIGARNTSHVDNAIDALSSGIDDKTRAEMSSWLEPD